MVMIIMKMFVCFRYFDACLFFCGEELVHRNDGEGDCGGVFGIILFSYLFIVYSSVFL